MACGLHVACQPLFCSRKISSPSTQVSAQTPCLPQWVTEYPPTSQLYLFALLEMKVSLHFKLQEFLQLLSLTLFYIITDDFVSFHPRQSILLRLIPVSFSLDSISSIFLLDSCPFNHLFLSTAFFFLSNNSVLFPLTEKNFHSTLPVPQATIYLFYSLTLISKSIASTSITKLD